MPTPETAQQTAPHLDPTHRMDFVLLFDVTDGNPNGDPDAGNLPRVDPQTMQGLVTDVAIKRKVRNWIDAAHGTEDRNKIYVQEGVALNAQHRRAYTDLGIPVKGKKQPPDEIAAARTWMCNNFYDIRTFGAVMTTGVNCGQVRGPVHFVNARSIDPIVPLDLSITRVAVTREEDPDAATADDNGEEAAGGGKRTEMGRKPLIPYGLYQARGFFTPSFAAQTGANSDDLALFWQALLDMWDLDRSATRGLTSLQGLHVFVHEHRLGNAPAHQLFRRITVARRPDVAAPRSIDDYKITINDTDLPNGVQLVTLFG